MATLTNVRSFLSARSMIYASIQSWEDAVDARMIEKRRLYFVAHHNVRKRANRNTFSLYLNTPWFSGMENLWATTFVNCKPDLKLPEQLYTYISNWVSEWLTDWPFLQIRGDRGVRGGGLSISVPHDCHGHDDHFSNGSHHGHQDRQAIRNWTRWSWSRLSF